MLDERANPPNVATDTGRPNVTPTHAVEVEATTPDRRKEDDDRHDERVSEASGLVGRSSPSRNARSTM